MVQPLSSLLAVRAILFEGRRLFHKKSLTRPLVRLRSKAITFDA